MRSLLDVNILLALLDDGHIFYQRTRRWLENTIETGWASCPMTQAGFVRMISGTGYPAPVKLPAAMAMLQKAVSDPHHQFWPDDVPLAGSRIDPQHLLSHNQVTDSYLLALAVAHDGRLVTLDRRITLTAVPGASPDNLVVL
jgi:toxin-antitoxin system PIN domain toxin